MTRWQHIPRTQEQIRRTRVGNVRIEIGLMYPDNFRDWRVYFYWMRPRVLANIVVSNPASRPTS